MWYLTDMTFVLILEVIGTIAFAVSGALTAVRKKLDIFGVVMLGFTTALGGGIIRDVLLGVIPPMAFRNPFYALLAAALNIISAFLQGGLDQHDRRGSLLPDNSVCCPDFVSQGDQPLLQGLYVRSVCGSRQNKAKQAHSQHSAQHSPDLYSHIPASFLLPVSIHPYNDGSVHLLSQVQFGNKKPLKHMLQRNKRTGESVRPNQMASGGIGGFGPKYFSISALLSLKAFFVKSHSRVGRFRITFRRRSTRFSQYL